MPNILLGGLLGGAIGGAAGFIGSAIEQKINGGEFDARKAWASAANGLIVGGTRGALLASGVGIPLALTGNFTAGAVGNAVEQGILNGKVDAVESITSGLTNAASGAIYGNGPLKSAASAFGRGAGAGAATAGINSLSNSFRNRNKSMNLGIGGSGISSPPSPYTKNSDPKAGCQGNNPFHNQNPMGQTGIRGYQYGGTEEREIRGGGVDLIELGKEVALGAVMGGFSSLTFYGVGKGVEGIRRSIKGGSSAIYNTSGLTNAISSAIYRKNPFKNAKNAFGRGMGAGAATAGINNLSNAFGTGKEE